MRIGSTWSSLVCVVLTVVLTLSWRSSTTTTTDAFPTTFYHRSPNHHYRPIGTASVVSSSWVDDGGDSSALFAKPPGKQKKKSGGPSGPNKKKKKREPKKNTNVHPNEGGGKVIDVAATNDDNDDNAVRTSKSWIERSLPTGMALPEEEDLGVPADYALSIDGDSFGIGPLSVQMYDALTTVASARFPDGAIPSDLETVYATFAMDLAAKEAVSLALKESGMQFDHDDDDDNEEWGDVERVSVDHGEDGGGAVVYDSFEECARGAHWTVGDNFSFVVRNVRAKQQELDMSALLAQLDPSGAIREELEERPVSEADYDDFEIVEYGDDDTIDDLPQLNSLQEVGEDNERRCNVPPVEATMKDEADNYDNNNGVTVVSLESLLETEDLFLNHAKAVNNIMRAMDAHSSLIVDVGEANAKILHNMWQATDDFFATPDLLSTANPAVPAMAVAPEAGSKHAVVGFAAYEEGAMQFLETRIRRKNQALLPVEVSEIVSKNENSKNKNNQNNNNNQDNSNSIVQAFQVMAKLGKTICTLATAAATVESNYDNKKKISRESAYKMASQMTQELLDDGTSIDHDDHEEFDTAVSMSPHRMCRYSSLNNDTVAKNTAAKEVFGAHTDTSFLTIVPAAAVSGLEIFDGAAWTRPELTARRHYDNNNDDNDDDTIPWHCRYVVVMTGELLQLSTRGMIRAAVHRVVAVTNGEARQSAPVLLRARANREMDVRRYFVGDSGPNTRNTKSVGELLLECDRMTMEQIHDALQP